MGRTLRTGRSWSGTWLSMVLVVAWGAWGAWGSHAQASPPQEAVASVVRAGQGASFSPHAVMVTWVDASEDELQFAVQRESLRDGTWRDGLTLRVLRNTTAVMDNPGSGEHRYRVRGEGERAATEWSAWTVVQVGGNGGGEPPLPVPPVAPPTGGPSNRPAPPSTIDPLGFIVPAPSGDSRIVHISTSGNDANDGATPARPIRTFLRAYELMRDRFPDHLLLRAGDVFENASIVNGYGGWDKGGRSRREPMVIGVYGDGPRPMLRVRDAAAGMLLMGNDAWNGNMIITGLHFVNDRPDPDRGGVGLRMFGIGGNIHIEDCVFENFTGNVSFESSINNDSDPSNWIVNVTLRRCVLRDAYAGNGHSQGAYFSMVDGLLIDECVVDHNGWSETIPGKVSTIYNHNFYVQPSCTRVLIRNTISTRAAATGAQMRGRDQSVVDCLFVDNAIHLTAGHGQAQWPSQAWKGRFLGNVLMGGTDIGLPGSKLEPRGFGIGIACSDGGVVRGNIISQLTGGAKIAFWLNEPNVSWDVEGNIVYEPTARFVRDDRRIETKPVLGVNMLVTEPDSMWPDPSRNVATYMRSLGAAPDKSSLSEFLDAARSRGRGAWDARFTAERVNAYIREGFAFPAPSDLDRQTPKTVEPVGF